MQQVSAEMATVLRPGMGTAVTTTARGERGSPTIAVLPDEPSSEAPPAGDVIRIPGAVDELLFAPLTTLVGQLFGYHLGLAKGFNPDCLGTDDLSHARDWLTSFPLGTH